MKINVKSILGYVFVFLIPFFLLIIVFNFRPYKQDIIPKLAYVKEKKYIHTSIGKRKIYKKFSSDGIIIAKDNNIIKLEIEKDGHDVILNKKIGYIFKKDEIIYSIDSENKSFNFDGMILSIKHDEYKITLELLNYFEQNISAKLSFENINKLSLIEKIIIKKDDQEFKCDILSIDHKIIDGNVNVLLSSNYTGFIDESVEILFVEFEKDGFMIIKDFVIFENNKHFVIIMENNEYKKIEIQVGIQEENSLELISPLLYDGIDIYSEYNG